MGEEGGAGMRMGGRRGWRDEGGMEEGDELEVLNEIETLLFFLSATLGCHELPFFFPRQVFNPTYCRYLDTLTQLATPPAP